MDDKEMRTQEQVKQFVDSSRGIEFKGLNLKEKYQWTQERGGSSSNSDLR
jgi:hypothetical protein